VARLPVILVAAAVVVLLAVQFQAQRHERRGIEAVNTASDGKATPDVVARGLDDLEKARRFRADGSGLRSEANLLLFSGHFAQASRVARELVDAEPENFDGWVAMNLASPDRSGPQAKLARARALQLNPFGAGSITALEALPALRQAYRRAQTRSP